MGTISVCLNLKENLKKKFSISLLYYPKMSKQIKLKLYWLKIFSICHHCRRHPWCTLSCKYIRKFLKNLNGPNRILRDLGETDSWENLKLKTSCHCPFKFRFFNPPILFLVRLLYIHLYVFQFYPIAKFMLVDCVAWFWVSDISLWSH